MAHLTFFKKPRPTAEQRRQEKIAKAFARRRQRRTQMARGFSASSSPSLALQKGPTREAIQKEKRVEKSAFVQAVRRHVFDLSTRCVFCNETEAETSLRQMIWTHQMHEDPSRQKTRGLPLEQRFSIFICGRTCAYDHVLATRNILKVVFHDLVQRWRGDYDVVHETYGLVAVRYAGELVVHGDPRTW